MWQGKFECGFFLPFPSPNSNEQTLIQNEVVMNELIYSPITCADIARFLKKDPIVANVFDCFKWITRKSE